MIFYVYERILVIQYITKLTYNEFLLRFLQAVQYLIRIPYGKLNLIKNWLLTPIFLLGYSISNLVTNFLEYIIKVYIINLHQIIIQKVMN
jgi:hypothetical protein